MQALKLGFARRVLGGRDGGSPRQLTFGDQDLFSPWWSPDGSRLVYSHHSWTDTAISVIELSSPSVTTIPNSQGFCCPTWSHDGRHLFAAATSPPRLMMYDMAEKRWSELWRGVFDYSDVFRDGSYLYFDSVWEYDPAVYRLLIRDRKLEKVVSLKNFRRTRGANGYWFDLALTTHPSSCASTEQLYELEIDHTVNT